MRLGSTKGFRLKFIFVSRSTNVRCVAGTNFGWDWVRVSETFSFHYRMESKNIETCTFVMWDLVAMPRRKTTPRTNRVESTRKCSAL